MDLQHQNLRTKLCNMWMRNEERDVNQKVIK